MQLRALDENQPILAKEGKRDKEYLCPECLSPLKRKSFKKEYAFVHRALHSPCRGSKKTLHHLQLLLQILKRVPQDEIYIEKFFPEIGRTVDLFWEKKGILFCIQSAPVGLAAIQAQYSALQNLPYSIVWILDSRCFNRRRVLPEEEFLRSIAQGPSHVCYFAEMHEASCLIFDQFEAIRWGKRVEWGPRLRVDIGSPSSLSHALCFAGDLKWREAKGKKEQALYLQELKREAGDRTQLSLFTRVKQLLNIAYKLILSE